MTYQQAVKILMQSPIYFRLGPIERLRLIHEYCRLYSEVRKKSSRKE